MTGSSKPPRPTDYAAHAAHAWAWACYAEALRPPPDLSPSQFAERYRKLHAIYCSEHPGPWSNDVFPYHRDVMDAVQEALREGKKGVAFMKAGQIGGTDCMINAQLWAKLRYPGPQLFMTSTDKVAEEFGRERFELVIEDMEPLARKYLDRGHGQILVKRFSDGKIVLCGGQSVFNLQSNPYRIVVIDELDSLVDSLAGSGDPLKLAEVRTDSFSGETLIIAYAHPSTKDRGAGRLYYADSDQRRGFISHRCGHEFWLNWLECVRCSPCPGQTREHAEKDPDCYHLCCPGCGQKIDEAERVAMLRAGVRQRSVLPPEEAAKKRWIGVHASQLYTPAKTLRSFAERWIETDCGRDENAARVFVNKVLGDVYEPKVKTVDLSALRSLIVAQRRQADPEHYLRGQVPPSVLFLTAGQDSRSTQLHYAVWGWGVRESIDQTRSLCGWLIDWGEDPAAILADFQRGGVSRFRRSRLPPPLPLRRLRRLRRLRMGRRGGGGRGRGGSHVHGARLRADDIGYPPTQIPLTRYCRSFPGRAMPSKGASEEASSASQAPYVRMGAARRFRAGDIEVVDDPALLLNTYMLKTDWYGWIEQRIEVPDLIDGQRVGTRKVARLCLPEDVDDLWLSHAANEQIGRGKRKGELVWKRKGPNHLADCNTYAYGVALHFDPHAKNMTAEEYGQRRAQARRPVPATARPAKPYSRHTDPAMG